MPKIIQCVDERIIAEAKNLLINGDYESFNIRDLSKRCKISVGTIYNHFPNKYELIHSIFVSDWNKTLENIKSTNSKENSFYKKLNRTYLEIDRFLGDYMSVFLDITAKTKSHKQPPEHALEPLYTLIDEMVDIERSKGNLKTKVPNEKLNKFIVYNLMLLCSDKALTFDEVYSLMNL